MASFTETNENDISVFLGLKAHRRYTEYCKFLLNISSERREIIDEDLKDKIMELDAEIAQLAEDGITDVERFWKRGVYSEMSSIVAFSQDVVPISTAPILEPPKKWEEVCCLCQFPFPENYQLRNYSLIPVEDRQRASNPTPMIMVVPCCGTHYHSYCFSEYVIGKSTVSLGDRGMLTTIVERDHPHNVSGEPTIECPICRFNLFSSLNETEKAIRVERLNAHIEAATDAQQASQRVLKDLRRMTPRDVRMNGTTDERLQEAIELYERSVKNCENRLNNYMDTKAIITRGPFDENGRPNPPFSLVEVL